LHDVHEQSEVPLPATQTRDVSLQISFAIAPQFAVQ